MFNIIKRFYDRGIYTAENVAMFVKSGRITTAQYKEITNIDYGN